MDPDPLVRGTDPSTPKCHGSPTLGMTPSGSATLIFSYNSSALIIIIFLSLEQRGEQPDDDVHGSVRAVRPLGARLPALARPGPPLAGPPAVHVPAEHAQVQLHRAAGSRRGWKQKIRFLTRAREYSRYFPKNREKKSVPTVAKLLILPQQFFVS